MISTTEFCQLFFRNVNSHLSTIEDLHHRHFKEYRLICQEFSKTGHDLAGMHSVAESTDSGNVRTYRLRCNTLAGILSPRARSPGNRSAKWLIAGIASNVEPGEERTRLPCRRFSETRNPKPEIRNQTIGSARNDLTVHILRKL